MLKSRGVTRQRSKWVPKCELPIVGIMALSTPHLPLLIVYPVHGLALEASYAELQGWTSPQRSPQGPTNPQATRSFHHARGSLGTDMSVAQNGGGRYTGAYNLGTPVSRVSRAIRP